MSLSEPIMMMRTALSENDHLINSFHSRNPFSNTLRSVTTVGQIRSNLVDEEKVRQSYGTNMFVLLRAKSRQRLAEIPLTLTNHNSALYHLTLNSLYH